MRTKPKEKKKPFVITRLEFKEDSGEGYLTGDLVRAPARARPRDGQA